tara:strand:+ start:1781 stop:3214 length:1434 start_codon:yes stop_codon:yes gene_type:complete
MKLNLIFNRNIDNIIGIYDNLLFNISNDLKWFRKHTTSDNSKQNVVIMGKTTWLSLKKKPLPGRLNIILSKNDTSLFSNLKNDNIKCFSSLETMFKFLNTIESNKIFVIGGSIIFQSILKDYPHYIDCIYETKVNKKYPLSITDKKHVRKLENNFENNFYYQLYEKNCNSDGIMYNSFKEKIDYQFLIYQKRQNINQNEIEYLNVLRKINKFNKFKNSRNSDVLSSFGEKMTFDLRLGFPLLTTKKMGYKTILRELLWFISGSTDNRILQKQNVYIWNQNASKEFMESRNLHYEEGDLGPIYGHQWRHYGEKYSSFNKKYKGFDQLQYVIDMIKNDPNSRRIILNSWNPCDIDKMALPPCHVMVQFYIEDDFIDCQLYQRSGDMFLGVPFNIASYSFLLHIIGKITGYTPRYLYHILGDAHIYENHLDVVDEQLQRVPYDSPNLIISNIKDINQITEDDFRIENYQCYSQLKTEMIA